MRGTGDGQANTSKRPMNKDQKEKNKITTG